MPFNPKKCIGKKVKLTPKNIVQNTTLTPKDHNPPPKKIGLHRVKPHKTPKTAPNDNT
jgi:hypothetical protein